MVTTPELIAIRRGQIRQLIEAGNTTPQIAQKLNERRTIIVSDIRALGLTPAKALKGPRNQERKDTLAAQVRDLAGAGTKRNRIAKDLSISEAFLRKIMAEYDIPLPVRAPEHGTLREYRTYKCRCQPCTAANTAAIAKARAARKARLSPDSPIHGTVSGYSNHLCRCAPCTAAGVEFYANYRATPAERTRRNWTPEEDAAILDYTQTAKAHAEALGRPVASITSRRTYLLRNGAVRRYDTANRAEAAAAQVRAAAVARRKETRSQRRAAEAELHREEAAAAERLALETILTESRRGAVAALARQGMSRANIMATLDLDYETLRNDLEVLQIPVVAVSRSTQRQHDTHGYPAATRRPHSVLVGR